ncbi:MAG: ligase-associated DNA damage response exonuclease [Pseudorhodoplanes sp.]
MRPERLLLPTPSGVCCERGGFHIDPTRPVERALITHAHADHARPGHGAVLATRETLDIMRLRYGPDFAGTTQAIAYGDSVRFGDVTATFHPAGHVLGSAQIAVQCGSLRIVASGDYKDVPDPTCVPFELVACDVFITEATFGLPVFRHSDPDAEIARLIRSTELFPERAHLVGAYTLGKAQRLIALIRKAGCDKPIWLHGAMQALCDYYMSRGVDLGELRPARDAPKDSLAGAIALCPPSALKEVWSRRFPEPVTAYASGWMRTRARARQSLVELPLVISDHADWDGLRATIAATGASEIWVTHGQEDALVHWCTSKGLTARPLAIVGYGDEDETDGVTPFPSPLVGEDGEAQSAEPGGGSLLFEQSSSQPLPSRRAAHGDLPHKGGGNKTESSGDAS